MDPIDVHTTTAQASKQRSPWRAARPSESEDIIAMCRGLNAEDPGPAPVPDSHMKRTLETLNREPARGFPVVLEVSGYIEDYALLISFWSNELGGEICNIDELYVKPGSRGRGYGGALVTAITDQPSLYPRPLVAIELEVTPQNTRARDLYERLGFKAYKNSMLRFDFETTDSERI